MTENTTRVGFVEDLGPLFGVWSDPDGRECLRDDFAEKGAEELARGFKRAELLLRGLALHAEEAIGYGTVCVLYDAIDQARRARRVAESYIEEGS